MTPPAPLVLAITGASGAPYRVRLLAVLARNAVPVELIVSSHGWRLLQTESGINDEAALKAATGGDWSSITVYPDSDRGARPASGSHRTRGMVICPCSMGTVSAIALGASRSLVERAADVTLKERRKLVVVPRETPLSLIHLRNLVALTEAGGVVIPAAPGFYHQPSTIDQLVDFISSESSINSSSTSPWRHAGKGDVRLGVISDTHGLLRPEVFEVFSGVDHILHAGDVGPLDILSELEAIAPVTAVYGNTDGFDIRAKLPHVAEVRLDGFDIVVTHGDQFGRGVPSQKFHEAFPSADILIHRHALHPEARAGGRGGNGDESRRGGAAPVRSPGFGGDPRAGGGDPAARETGPPHRGGRGLAARRTLQLAKVVDIPGPEREATPSGRCAER